MQGALADMLPRRAGAIVNILSMNAHCGTPELGIYAATKGALATLTKNAANAHLRDGVRVNGINLGWVDTPAERQQQAVTLGRGAGWLAEEAARMPLGRLLVPEEAARLAVFLLSPASAPMTGAVIDLEQKVTGA
jgi:NAD(P)-dependent dehydrogenase (short-subunit alcohol dehydrogenase family)